MTKRSERERAKATECKRERTTEKVKRLGSSFLCFSLEGKEVVERAEAGVGTRSPVPIGSFDHCFSFPRFVRICF